MNRVEEFRQYRERMNARIHEEGTLLTQRFFALDTRCYEDGALDRGTKEMLGLVASLVLRCDDCIQYHLTTAVQAGVRRQELMEVFDVGLVVGGSIVIPHLRRAHEFLDELMPPSTEA